MSESVTDQGTQEAETPAESTEITSQLPTGEITPPAQDPPAEEAPPTETGQAPETESGETGDEVVQVNGGRKVWDKRLAKANEEAAELRKQNAKLIELLAANKAVPAPATAQAPAEDDVETLIAKAEQVAAKAKETFDPADLAEAQEINAKVHRAILKKQRETAEAIKAREQQDTVAIENQRREAALHAEWNKSGISVAEGSQLVAQAFQRADARGLKGAERQAAAEMAYALLYETLKQSKKSPPAQQQTTTTASATSGKTPAGTKLTPRNPGVQLEPLQRGQAAKIIGGILG